MTGPTEREGAWATATLRRSLQLVSTREGRLIAASAAGIYVFAALLVGKMLVFGPTGETSVSTVYLANGQPWWLFPMYIVLAPNAVLELPLFALAAMVLVGTGIGIGMGVAGVLALRLLRWRRRTLASPTALGSVAGLTPAMIALLTLGACCSTTAAATAGIGVVANATGTTTDNLLLNPWFLSIFQLAVLWVALVAQERLIVVYSALLDPMRLENTGALSIRPDRRTLGVGLLRVLLLAAAVTWALSMVATWAVVAPGTASTGQWAGWLFLVQLPAVTVGVLAISPSAIAGIGRGTVGRIGAIGGRSALVVAGGLLLAGVPPPLDSIGFHGLGNELLGVLGLPASSGAIVMPGFPPVILAFRWALQLVPLGLTALALGLWPGRSTRALTFRPTAPIRPEGSPRGPTPAPVPAPGFTTSPSSPEHG
ncbi:MAG: hypothetical protein L3K08_07365 [Thermoplasmata archaeon]|nr:hypothetical protein [Thermoplasmata archaeon]